MNPYAGHMGDKAPLDVISETPRRLAQLVETIGPERLETLARARQVERARYPFPSGGR